MSFYRVCPYCGAHLDPGKRCTCTLTQVCAEARATFPGRFRGMTDRQIVSEIKSVILRAEKNEAAQGAANALDGKVEHVDHAVSTSIVHKDKEGCQV